MLLYHRICEGIFIERLNRFNAVCSIDGSETTCHLANTGRLRELLVPGTKIWLNHANNPARKTAFDLVAVAHDSSVINIDSLAPNRVFLEYLHSGQFRNDIAEIKPEYVYGESRIDFGWKTQQGSLGLTEIKGVTLFNENSVALFPDAPTERGLKHLHELTQAARHGVLASVCFILMRDDVIGFSPNANTHPAFGEALAAAKAAGVRIEALCCDVSPDSVVITHGVPVLLPECP